MRLFFLLCGALQPFPGKIFQQIKWEKLGGRYIFDGRGCRHFGSLWRGNSRLNESVLRVQLDTYELHHQTSHCGAERGAKGREGSRYRVNRSSGERQVWEAAIHLLQAVAGGQSNLGVVLPSHLAVVVTVFTALREENTVLALHRCRDNSRIFSVSHLWLLQHLQRDRIHIYNAVLHLVAHLKTITHVAEWGLALSMTQLSEPGWAEDPHPLLSLSF